MMIFIFYTDLSWAIKVAVLTGLRLKRLLTRLLWKAHLLSTQPNFMAKVYLPRRSVHELNKGWIQCHTRMCPAVNKKPKVVHVFLDVRRTYVRTYGAQTAWQLINVVFQLVHFISTLSNTFFPFQRFESERHKDLGLHIFICSYHILDTLATHWCLTRDPAGLIEQLIGKYAKDKEKVVVATKYLPLPFHFNAWDTLVNHLKMSLQRLNRDHVDLYQVYLLPLEIK